jgi:hypothetical protein
MRLPSLKTEEMSERQRELAARIAGKRGHSAPTFALTARCPKNCVNSAS